jgi:6-phosphogluconolactonase (cycloisomerase 2 family)
MNFYFGPFHPLKTPFYTYKPRIEHFQLDNHFLLASLRKYSSFTIPSPLDPTATIPSDSLLTYAINPSSGALTLIDAVAAGGSSPKQFSLNKAGDKIAVSVQNDGWVVVFERDAKTEKVGERVAVVRGLGEGGVVCTV